MKHLRTSKFLPAYSWLLLTSLLLSSCVHQGASKSPLISQDWTKHQAQVESITNWQATGKLGIKVPNDGGSANLHWQQQSRDYQIDLNGPFGQNKMIIDGKPGSVTLAEAGQAPQTAKTAEELIHKNTGWNIPVTQLAFWVRGLPAPDSKIIHFEPNAVGLIGELQQAGWKITYSDYTNVVRVNAPKAEEVITMPGRIIAEYKDIRLTLVIREWKLDLAQDKQEP
jgi:outer membrane lipoprotein LolB